MPTANNPLWRRPRVWLLAAAMVFVLAAAGFIIWANTTNPVMPQALDALKPDTQVAVDTETWLVFDPDGTETTGFIFYPGGRVDPRAYAPPARAIAEEGYLVVIVPMPLNLAVLNINAASTVMDAYPGIAHWAIGGHSLGGAMAAQYATNHPGTVEGLALWASYPPNDLSAQNIAVISIYGKLDGLAKVEDVEGAADLLPPDTVWISIGGGNHAQFGYYGAQAGDNPATLSREDQQASIINGTVGLLVHIAD